MLTRLYVDNYRALVNSELPLLPRTLLLGRNGTGKSSFGDVLMRIQMLLYGASKTDEIFGPNSLTRWQQVPHQTFELDVQGPSGQYQYHLKIEHRDTSGTEEPRTKIVQETLTLDSRPLFSFVDGTVHLYRDDHAVAADYPFDISRAALGTITPRSDNHKLSWFNWWFRGLTVLQPNPQAIAGLVEQDDFLLLVTASNFAAWYHAASAADKRRDLALHNILSEVLPGFDALNFEPAGPGRWYLRVDFSGPRGSLPLYLPELSDGQRSLILLYAVLYFLVAQGRTVFLDEPDNFVALEEIQPWLLTATDMVDDGQGQIVIVSHHPEIFNQWAPSHGFVTHRDSFGPVRVRKFTQPPDLGLTPSEAVARGWISKTGGASDADPNT
jgi:predicted ATPase